MGGTTGGGWTAATGGGDGTRETGGGGGGGGAADDVARFSGMVRERSSTLPYACGGGGGADSSIVCMIARVSADCTCKRGPVVPRPMIDPCVSAWRTPGDRRAFPMYVPFRDPVSSTHHWPSARNTRAWLPDTAF